MKLHYRPDPTPFRREAYLARREETLEALWDAIKHLHDQGIDIGDAAKAELREIAAIKAKFPD